MVNNKWVIVSDIETIKKLEHDVINEYINRNMKITGSTSDGYHTFDELYYHRMILFSVICNTYKDISWKSKFHHDETMYPNYFIVGINTPKGSYTYHYNIDYWDMFNIIELERAPEWDGHQPKDIDRMLSLIKNINE